MRAIVQPGFIDGTVKAPPSKSMTQRAYAAALLQKGRSVIHNAGFSSDEMAALAVIQQLGAKIIGQDAGTIELISDGVSPKGDDVNCGESGLAARLFTPIAALANKPVRITGNGTLLRRPMHGFNEALGALGIKFSEFNGNLPITVHGPLNSIAFKLDASLGSQFLSGLLFAISANTKEVVTIEVADLKSKPYIDMTLDILKISGRPVKHNDYTTFTIDPADFTPKQLIEFNIEGDWSSAANLLVAGAISGNVSIKNLDINTHQADREILNVIMGCGAECKIENNAVSVKASQLDSFDFDATHCPDLFPILSVLAACADGESSIRGVHRLFIKESNRAESISEMLQNFDVPFSIEDDCLFIEGVQQLQGTVIDAYSDHRIVMAATVGALRANGPVDIMQSESADKSYPDFFRDLKSLGAHIEIAEH